MKNLIFASALLSIATPIYAYSQSANWRSQVWEGKIANLEIVLETQRVVDEKGKVRYAAHYFYKKHHKIINLYPDANGKTYYETGYDCQYNIDDKCASTGTITFDKYGDFSKGVWNDVTGKKAYLVDLKKVSQTDYSNGQKLANFENFYYAYGLNPNSNFYNSLVSGQFSDSKPQNFGINSVVYRNDKATKITYPRIHKFENATVKSKINAILDETQKQMIGDALECASMSGGNMGSGTLAGYDEYSAKVKTLNSRFFVIEESASLYCGGAHPNNMWFNNVFDMKDGSKFDFDKYFKLFDNQQDKADWKYSATFAAFMESLDENSKYLIADKDSFQAECLGSDMGYSYTLSLSEKGVVFTMADLPHVMGACMGEYFMVPYKDMKRFMTPNGLKFFAPELK